MSERRADHSRASVGEAAFFFAVECPRSYLAAERVERALGTVAWVPVLTRGAGCPRGCSASTSAAADHRCFARAEHEAEGLGLPLLEPEVTAADPLPAARAAAYAADQGAARSFALAAARLVFCGGWSADEPRLIREAAAAAGLDARAAVAASHDQQYDQRLFATTAGVYAQTGTFAPAVRLGEHWFSGPDAVGAAVRYRTQSPRRFAPSMPSG